KKKPPRPPRTKTRSNISNVFKRPRSDADAEDRAKYILTAARPAFKEVHTIHNGKWYQKGLWHRIRGHSRYHGIKYVKRSALDKVILATPGLVATGVGGVITLVGVATGPAGWIMAGVGLSALAITLGLKAFYRHRDYLKRKVYYQKEMYCTAEGKAKGEKEYDKKKAEAKGKWYRRFVVYITPKKLKSYVQVKDDAWTYKDYWREPLAADANLCIRPASVHLRKARYALTEEMGGFFKAIDPEVKDHYELIDLKKDDKRFKNYRDLERCDHYIRHAKPAMRYLHEVDKTRNYLLPALNLCAFCLDEFASMSAEWHRRQEIVESAINRFQKKNDHKQCGRFRFPKEIFYTSKVKALKSFIRFSNKHCYAKNKRPDLYLYHGQPGEATGSGKKTSGDKSSGKSGSPQPTMLDVAEIRGMLAEYAVDFQNRIKHDKLRVSGVQNPGTTPPETQRSEKFLADVARIYDKPGYKSQFSHRLTNYNMSTTKFEKVSCFLDHGYTITTTALAGGILPSVFKFGFKSSVDAVSKPLSGVIKFSLGKLEGGVKSIAEKIKGEADDRRAKALGNANDYCTFADGSNPYIVESDVLKTLKNELSIDTPLKRISAMENKAYEDEQAELKRELDEMLERGEIDEQVHEQGMAEVESSLYGLKKKRAKRQKKRADKAAKNAAIGVERTFKQLDYHYKQARHYVKSFREIDSFAQTRGEWEIELRSCSQGLRYARWLYGYHHELEKMERYLMGCVSVIAQLSEEVVTYGEYVPAIWEVLDGNTGQWIRESSNHNLCLGWVTDYRKSKGGKKRKWFGRHCYGPTAVAAAKPTKPLRKVGKPAKSKLVNYDVKGGVNLADVTCKDKKGNDCTVEVKFRSTGIDGQTSDNKVSKKLKTAFDGAVKAAAAKTEITSVTITATTNGKHYTKVEKGKTVKKSRHYVESGGKALDIGFVNDRSVGSIGRKDPVKALQEAFESQKGRRSNFGPYFTRKSGEGFWAAVVIERYKTHVHWSVN
ncbi:MAG: hypothetical protein GY867_03455, partial [bacterium]|nr:hypothetical protein [bacterium]